MIMLAFFFIGARFNWLSLPTLNQFQEKQSREFALCVHEYQVVPVNSTDRRDHVLCRLQRDNVGLVSHVRKCMPVIDCARR
jgi:hypothetical protein